MMKAKKHVKRGASWINECYSLEWNISNCCDPDDFSDIDGFRVTRKRKYPMPCSANRALRDGSWFYFDYR